MEKKFLGVIIEQFINTFFFLEKFSLLYFKENGTSK